MRLTVTVSMIKIIKWVLLLTTCFLSESIFAKYYSENLCSLPGYQCFKVKPGDTWEKLFPKTKDRNLVERINRINIQLQPGAILAVPISLEGLEAMDFSPFEHHIEPPHIPTVLVDLGHLAFAFYDAWGKLIYWGPISAGKDWCSDTDEDCRTPTGFFQVQSIGDATCISTKYPLPDGGSPMPYCMYFQGGNALHAGPLPGYHDSHGCIRLFYTDAVWLNKELTKLGHNVQIVVTP